MSPIFPRSGLLCLGHSQAALKARADTHSVCSPMTFARAVHAAMGTRPAQLSIPDSPPCSIKSCFGLSPYSTSGKTLFQVDEHPKDKWSLS